MTPDDLPPCATCRFWRRHTRETGECRRRAPGPPADPAPGVAGRFGVYPLTTAGPGCGDHEQREAPRAR